MRTGRVLVTLGVLLINLGVLLILSVGSQSQEWKQLGPAPIEHSRGGAANVTASGLINDIAIDPTGPTDSTIYIATSAGGVWRTTDGGGKWTPLTDQMPVQTIGAVALDPNNPTTVYAGVGSCYWYCLGGGGIYRSINGGQSWTLLNPGDIFTGLSIDRIVLPASKVLLVSTNNGLYKSVDGGEHFGNNPPVIAHPFNSFDNSQPIPIATPNGIVSNGHISDLKLDTVTSTTVYAAIDGTGVFKSTDSGSTFPASGTLLSSSSFPSSFTGDVFIKFAQSTNPNNGTMYAFLCIPSSQCALLKSVNGGAFGNIPITSEISNNQGNYDQVAGVDPQDANKVYLGLRRLFFSGDGGGHFGQSSTGISPDPFHPDVHAIAFSTASPPPRPYTRIFVGNDGGFSSTAAQGSVPGSQWQFLNNGLGNILFYRMDMGRGSIENDAYIYGASQDNGFALRSGANTWNPNQACCGDDYGVAVDPTNHTHAFGIFGPGCGPFVAVGWPGPAFPGSLCLVSFDPNGGTGYAAAGPQLFMGKTTASTSVLMHTFKQNITAMSQAKMDSNTFWVGLADGSVAVTTNAQQGAQSSWIAQTIPGAPGQQVTGIAVDPADTNTVAVVYPGFTGFDCPTSNANCKRTRHVFLTRHGGSTWHNRSGTAQGNGDDDLPDLPLNAVVIVPYTSPHTIVVGSDAGVMQSADWGETWQVLGTGFPTVEVTTLAFDYDTSPPHPPVLRAATFGRGVFELPFYPDPPQCQSTTRCNASIDIVCTGLDVGIEFPACSGGRCSIGFNGSSTVSENVYRADPQGTACSANESTKTCITLDFHFGGAPTGPPGSPCQPCPAGQQWCDKYNPPRCVQVQDCLVTPTHPDQSPPH